jgi:vitamin B12 transporter
MMPLRSITTVIYFLIVVSATAFGQKQERAKIAGVIRDGDGAPLPMVNVQMEGTYDGDATDPKGKFAFTTRTLGKGVVRASLIGYEPVNLTVTLSGGDSIFLNIEMKETLVMLGEVVVTGSAFTIGDEPKALTLQSLDVITTPGTSADLLHAIQTLPGVAAVDEGAGLFVRGGDVSETTILLDQATVVHPYKFESPTGGYFGSIPPFLLGGTFFSSGGFSARYGNTLSGVLAMESMNMPATFTTFAGLGLAVGSLGVNIPIIGNSLGIRISGNKSFTDAMLRMNGTRGRFTIPPDGFDGNLSVIWKYSPHDQIKFFNFVNTDRIGVQVDEPSFTGVYESREVNRLHNLQWSRVMQRWLMKGSLSLNRFYTEQELGNLRLKPSNIAYKARFDAEGNLDDEHRLSVGVECEKMTNRYEGTVPLNPAVLDPNASTYALDEEYSAVRVGAYSEFQSALSRRVVASLGVRSDYYDLSEEAVVDPRVSCRYDFSKEMHARVAWGIYHQFAQPYLYNRVTGNPQLSSQEAQHVVAGVEYSTELLMCRVEAYQKRYSHLVLRAAPTHYVNIGDGTAAGFDFFFKYGGFLRTPISGWISYSFLRARRLQSRDLVQRIVYERAPSPFDITYNLTVVSKIRLIQLVTCGLTFRYATGVPVTPIIGAIQAEGGDYYEPIQGPVNSERMPAFCRLDATVACFLPFGDSNSATFYFSVSNVLNRANPVAYEYSADYTQRRLRTTDYRRFIYFGVSVSLGSYDMGG